MNLRQDWSRIVSVLAAAAGAALTLAGAAARAAETATGAAPRVLYVNNVAGSDAFDGLSATPAGNGVQGPLASLGKALMTVTTAGRIDIANTGKPYVGGNTLVAAGGTADKPLVIEGNGALISGLAPVPKEKWTPVRDGIVATAFYPMSNWLKGYAPIQCWIGAPQIWWLDGQPAPNCRDETELEKTPGGFYWNKPHKELWVHLPPGRTLDNTVIEIPVYGTCICINTDFVVVRNLRAMLSENDGFDTHGSGKHIVYQNCIATDNCGQGFSVHDTNVTLYEDCLAERNASSGSCDVNDSHSYYRRCVFVNNAFEAGVYSTETSKHTYESCLLLGNRPFEQIWQRNRASMTFINCVIAGVAAEPKDVLLLENGSVHFRECTLADADALCRFAPTGLGTLSVVNCVLARFRAPFLDVPPGAANRVSLKGNVYFGGPGIRVGERTYAEVDWTDYQKLATLDGGSVWQDPKLGGRAGLELLPESPLSAARQAKPARTVGAVLPPAVWALYERTRGEVATPGGIRQAGQ